MTFGTIERSRQKGAPASLFLFVYGNGANSYYAYTDAEQAITFEGKVYQPIPIDRGSFSSSGTLDKAAITVRTPKNVPVADLFRIFPPSQVVNLFIRQGHLNDPDNQYLVCWSGRVLSCSREDNEAHFTCEPISTSLKRNGLRRNYQYGCPHVLYGPQCRANKAIATTLATPVSINGATLTLAPGWSTIPLKYAAGLCEWTSTSGDTLVRTILRVTGSNVFLLSGPIVNLPPGAQVRMVLGCNHQTGTAVQPHGDCLPLHNNIHNFGGQPWIPPKSPLGARSQYY